MNAKELLGICDRLIAIEVDQHDGICAGMPVFGLARAIKALLPILEAAESLHFFMTPLNEMGAKISELDELIAAAREVIWK